MLTAALAVMAAAIGICDLASETSWMERWFTAWELTEREILQLPPADPPQILFYDAECVYTTSPTAAAGAVDQEGPGFREARLKWRVARHNDTLSMPDGSTRPVRLLSFASSDTLSGPYFVMAAPSYWAEVTRSQNSDYTSVFIHEFTHARQIEAVKALSSAIDSAFPGGWASTAVQTRFEGESTYVAAYIAERDLLYRAAAADSSAEARTLAEEALRLMRARHARWFVGENAVFALMDATFLLMEGTAQWAAASWLAHPRGGGLTREAAVARMLGRRRVWAQDEGLGLFLLLDRLLPQWPSLVFDQPSLGALDLLELAVSNANRR